MQRPRRTPPSLRLDERSDLATEPRLADPGRAEHGDDLRPPLADRLLPERADDVELPAASDERDDGRPALAVVRGGLSDHPGCEGLTLALDLQRRDGLEDEGVACRAVRLVAGEQAPCRRMRLEPRGRVDDVAHRDGLT